MLLALPAGSPAVTSATLYAYAGGTTPTGTSACAQADKCSLKAALANVAAGDTIVLEGQASGSSPVDYLGNWTLDTSGTSATSPVTIDGNGQELSGNDGVGGSACETVNCDGPVLTVANGGFYVIEDLTIEEADNTTSGYGGALQNDDGGTVTVANATVENNTAADGGAIDNADSQGSGTLSVIDSTFTEDIATHGLLGGYGGAIDNGSNEGFGQVSVSGSAFYGDSATSGGYGGDGGAIDNGDAAGNGDVTVSNSTFVGDSALDGAAIDNSDGGDGSLTVYDSTLGGMSSNSGGGGGNEIDNADNDGRGSVWVAADVFVDACVNNAAWTDAGYNATTWGSSCLSNKVATDAVGANVAGDLAALASNGGPTQTQALEAGDPAIGLIPNPTTVHLPGGAALQLCSGDDQRGHPRPAVSTDTTCDAGAFETGTVPTTLSTQLSAAGPSAANVSILSGTAVSDKASLSGGFASAALGTVTYKVYSDSACTNVVSAGSPLTITTPGTPPASASVTLTTTGTYYWKASYSGDPVSQPSGNQASASACGSEIETVGPRASATSLSCVPSPATVGGPSVCTVTATDTAPGAAVTPSGSVSFKSDSSGTFTASSCTLSGSGGSASCNVSYTSGSIGSGTHKITASYGGDSFHVTSTGSSGLSVVRPSATVLSCAPGTMTVGSASVCTATVTDTSTADTPISPTGSVSFTSDSSGTFTAGSCTLSGSGSSASCTVSYTPGAVGTGTHRITASYGGDGAHASSSASDGLSVSAPAGGSGGSSGSTSPGVASIGSAVVKGTTVTVPVTCTGGTSCAVTSTLSVLETLKGGKVVAVSASSSKTKTTTRTVMVGSVSVTVGAGQEQNVTLALNATGCSMLRSRHRLPAQLSASQTLTGASPSVSSQTVMFKLTKPKKKHG